MDLPPSLQARLLVRRDAELAPLTTLGVGGRAPWIVEPRSREELIFAVAELARAGLGFRLLGHGSNLLVLDEGVDEVVIHTRQLTRIYAHGVQAHALRAEAGASLARLVSLAQRQGLAGVEALAGIPGTVGGAVVGNAGGRQGSIGDRVTAVTLVEPRGGVCELPTQRGIFAYRSSPFRGRVVVDAVLQLQPDEPAAIRERVARVLHDKRQRQPLMARSAGCFFRNSDDLPGGQLVEQAGCKGLSVGRARVSEQHANFILNEGGARARDVLALARRVAAAVRARSGVELQLEVEVWGPRGTASWGPSGADSGLSSERP